MQETRVVKGDPKHGYWRMKPSLVGLSGAPLADCSRCCYRRHDGFRPEGGR